MMPTIQTIVTGILTSEFRACVSGLAGRQPLETAVRDASIAAALSCRAVDGRSGIPGPAEIRRAAGVETPSTAMR